MRKRYILIVMMFLLVGISTLIFSRLRVYKNRIKIYFNRVEVEELSFDGDRDGDGIDDMEDILKGAKEQIGKAKYIDKYYAGGYPPENEGVCTDVIWRSLREAGYELKDMIDEDIKENTELYLRVDGEPEPNIDFRRVKNLSAFFKRYAEVLTTEIIPGDVENLKEWQRGDIVVFDHKAEHIGIISDKRDIDGVPYMIHNSGPKTQENRELLKWNDNYAPIIYHFRFPGKK